MTLTKNCLKVESFRSDESIYALYGEDRAIEKHS